MRSDLFSRTLLILPLLNRGATTSVVFPLAELSKIIRRVSSGDAVERVNRMNPAARLARQAGDTKLIVSMRAGTRRERGHYRPSFGHWERVKA